MAVFFSCSVIAPEDELSLTTRGKTCENRHFFCHYEATVSNTSKVVIFFRARVSNARA